MRSKHYTVCVKGVRARRHGGGEEGTYAFTHLREQGLRERVKKCVERRTKVGVLRSSASPFICGDGMGCPAV